MLRPLLSSSLRMHAAAPNPCYAHCYHHPTHATPIVIIMPEDACCRTHAPLTSPGHVLCTHDSPSYSTHPILTCNSVSPSPSPMLKYSYWWKRDTALMPSTSASFSFFNAGGVMLPAQFFFSISMAPKLHQYSSSSSHPSSHTPSDLHHPRGICAAPSAPQLQL